MENRRIYSGFTPSFIYRKEQFAPVLVLEVVEQTITDSQKTFVKCALFVLFN